MIAHYATAELSCFLELGWKLPTQVIDTLAEARTVRGQILPSGGSWGLLSVACSNGIQTMSSDHKEEMRQLAISGSVPQKRRQELMDYCLEDVRTGAALWTKLEPHSNIGEAIMRGRYLCSIATMERRGIPGDYKMIKLLQESMPGILDATWCQARKEYPGVISPDGQFSSKEWLNWCSKSGIPWPLLPSGAPALDADTFKRMSDRYPKVQTMAYARKLRGQSRKFEYPMGDDGRLRCMLSPFGSDTGRNQPSNSRFIFGASAWARSAIAAPQGKVLAYIDYSSEEIGVAAALSRDEALLRDYQSGDPYMSFAIRAGAAPEGATKRTHPSERASYKIALLSLQYGIGDVALAQSLGLGVPSGRRLITAFRLAYPKLWTWRGATIDHVQCGGPLHTCLGWKRMAKPKDTANSIANFPVQAAGGEILRAAVIALEEAGHRVVAPVHDALLVEMDEDAWVEELREIRGLMSRAAEVVTGGLQIPTDVDLIFPGENYLDSRGIAFWKIVAPIIGRGPFRIPDEERDALIESQI